MGSGRWVLAFAARRNPVRRDDGGASDVRIREDVEIILPTRRGVRAER
jgi:hypothetical protein